MAVGLVLTGCGGDAPPDAGAPGGDEANGEEAGRDEQAGSGRVLWVLDNMLMLNGVDIGSGELVASTTEQVVEPFGAEVNALAAADGQVWVARSDGQILVIDGDSAEVAETLTFETGEFGINELALGGGSAYLAYGAEDGNPMVVRLDPANRTPQAEAPVIGDIHSFDGFAVDGETLWVLQGNGFELFKVDAQDLSTLGSVPLGRASSSLDSPMGENLYGYGSLAVVGETVWVVDDYHAGLLRVDKATLAAEVVADLSDLIADRQVALVANSSSFFIAASDDYSSEVARFDGATGERLATYELGARGAQTIAVTDDRLYVDQDEFGQIVEIDIASGQVLRGYDVYGELIALE